MGVDRTSYLLYGFKFTNEKEKDVIDENWDDLMEDSPAAEIFNSSDSGQALVYDYMCGEYCYVGLVLAKVDEYDDDNTIELNHEELYGLKDKLFECMKKWPNYLTDLCKDKFPKMYFFILAY